MDADDSGPCPLRPISANTVSHQQSTHQQLPHEHSQSISSTSSALSSDSVRRDSTGTTATTSSTHANHRPSNSVGDKVSQYNTLAMQSRHLERRAADAALKRAMLGREEAETEMRRYRDEAHLLRQALEEGNERERRVGERLEAVMENHGRAKETHAHTQALWEKETRRARKDIYKAQSANIKLQAELKASRDLLRLSEESLENEKERSRVREQEAFTARYEIVSVQEQLEQALARAQAAEQERDSFRTMAQNEEAARIAAEGRHPPPTKEQTPEPVSPFREHTPISQLDVVRSSAAAESEIEELTMVVEWERRRADRALDMVEFLETECRMHLCAGSKAAPRRRSFASSRRRTNGPEIADPSDLAVLRERREVSSTPAGSPRPSSVGVPHNDQQNNDSDTLKASRSKKPKLEGRRSTIFCPREGIFRTVSQQEATEIEARERRAAALATEGRDLDLDVRPPSTTAAAPPLISLPPMHTLDRDTDMAPRSYTRSPSVEPPSFAMTAQQRMSLQSLLNAPHELGQPAQSALSHIPTVPATASFPPRTTDPIPEESSQPPSPEKHGSFTRGKGTNGFGKRPRSVNDDSHYDQENFGHSGMRPHSSTDCYRINTTTTSVPLRSENASSVPGMLSRPPSSLGGLRVPSGGSAISFDASDPAYGPTMTREEALAQIQERRGRARSAAMGNMTPRKKMLTGVGEAGRNVSAPAGRAGSAKRP